MTRQLALKRTVQVGFVAAVTALAWFNVSASIMAVCAVVLVVMSGKLEDLVEFSFGPLKAKIERNLSESEKLLADLKEFAAIQARAANAASVYTGRFAQENDWIYQSVKRTEAGLRKLGLTEDQLKEAREDFVALTVGDAGSAAIGRGHLPMHLPEEARTEWRTLLEEHRGNPDKFEQYLLKWDQMTPERQERIDDMRWMIANQDVRDSAQYMRAHIPVKWPGQI